MRLGDSVFFFVVLSSCFFVLFDMSIGIVVCSEFTAPPQLPFLFYLIVCVCFYIIYYKLCFLALFRGGIHWWCPDLFNVNLEFSYLWKTICISLLLLLNFRENDARVLFQKHVILWFFLFSKAKGVVSI